ncbi:hypothetical protein CPB86DRAFT_843859 [Serendipita vermifera]|nr:hypothetical protein CPB86DRAFT_843859 [Serendipita vermifera]
MSSSSFQPVTDSSPRPGTHIKGKIVKYTRHARTDKLIWFTRTPSPDPEVEREARWLRSIERLDVFHLTRKLPEGAHHVPVSPTDPHSTWAISSGVVLGLQRTALPDFVDLESSRVGRAFKWQSTEEPSTLLHLVIFPDDPKNPLCPPYPGLPPIDFDDPENPITCFSDGGLGKWDPRYFPQLFDATCPWLPYHRAPRSVSWWYEEFIPEMDKGELLPRGLGTYDRPLVPFYLPVTEFFVWNEPGHPEKGGHWRQDLLASLFVARRSAEHNLLSNHRALGDYFPNFDFSPFKLPWYDRLEYNHARQWTTWIEGRDALGRTCRYIAEIEAFAHWLWAIRSMFRNPPYRTAPQRPYYEEFIGAWAGTISSKKEWINLHRGLVPLYLISELPSTHPIVKKGLKNGDLDAGERYRRNHFDFAHDMPNTVASLPTLSFANALVRNSYCRHDTVPCDIVSPRLVHPQSLLSFVWHDPSHTISAHKPWTSYIFTDPDVEMESPLQNLENETNRSLLSFKIEALQLFFVPPFSHVLTVEHYRHPLFWLIDEISEKAETHYEEHCDTAINYWWFRRVHGSKRELARALPYMFSYPANNIIIHSSYPFPGKSPLVGLLSMCHPSYYERHDRNPRHYFLKRINDERRQAALSSTSEPDFIWLPPEDVLILNHEEPAFEPLDFVEPVYDPPLQQIIRLEGVRDQAPDNNNVISLDDVEQLLKAQHAELEWQRQRHLFNPIKGVDLLATFVQPWRPTDVSEVFVWPLRVAGLHAESMPAKLLSVLAEQFSVSSNDIILVASYHEIGMSHTIELGLRHAEDALWVWCLLHGASADDRLLDVYPVKAMKGSGTMLIPCPPSGSDSHTRARRFHDLFALWRLWPVNGEFGTQLDGARHSLLSSEGDILSSASLTPSPFFRCLPSLLPEDEMTPAIQLSKPELRLDGIERLPNRYDLHSSVETDFQFQTLGFHQESSTAGSSRSKRRKVEFDVEGGVLNVSAHHGRRHKRSRDEAKDPTAARTTTSKERRSFAIMTRFRAEELRTACVLPLPLFHDPISQVPAPKVPTSKVSPSKDMVEIATNWWDWLDKCRDALDEEQDNPDASKYDWTILPTVFIQMARLRGVYGMDRVAIDTALQKRTPWVSKRQVSKDVLYKVASTAQPGPVPIHPEDLEDPAEDRSPEDLQDSMDTSWQP